MKLCIFGMMGLLWLLVVLHCYACVSMGHDFVGGTGEPNDPYPIATAQQLMDIGSDSNLLDKHYVLLNNIDLDPNLAHGQIFAQAVIAPDLNDTEAGFQGIPFSGSFDGNGYHISNIHIESQGSYLGLFGSLASGAHILNLGLIHAHVTGWRDHIGILVGENDGLVTGCYTEGSVNGNWGIGGLVGINNNGSLFNCYSMVEIDGSPASMGGLVGENVNGRVLYCSSTCLINTYGDRSGGLVGFNANDSTIMYSYSTGTVRAEDYVGGLVGTNYGSIAHCYSTCLISGDHDIGGLVGVLKDGSVSYCYSTGQVSGNQNIGGLVGGKINGSVLNSFWNTQTSAMYWSSGGTGFNTQQMMDIHTYGDAGWDFVDDADNGTEDIWYMSMDGYPRLVPFQGSGTFEDPYQIATARQLTSIASEPNLLDKHYVLVNHIDLDPKLPVSRVFDRAVIAPHGTAGVLQDTAFNGTLLGNGFTIRNLTIQGEGYLGLFGVVGEYAIIRDLGIVDSNVVGYDMASNNGILAGYNYGEVRCCFSTGTVQANKDVGGLVGFNDSNVINCYSRSAVRGDTGVGGFAGHNGSKGIVNQCYGTGKVIGNMEVGGLIGGNEGYVSRSFWDVDTSGQADSAGGTGRSTAQMQDINTFLDAGWDFVDHTINGTEDIWIIHQEDYPHLTWELAVP